MVGLSGISPTSPQWVEQLVNQTMAYERQPLTKLESQRDTLNVKNAIYSDISSKINDLKSAIAALNTTEYGVTDAFAAKAISVTNANPDVDVAGVSLDGSSAVNGVYDLTVTKLAQAHQIGSAQQDQSTEALGYSGTFVIGGADTASVSASTGTNNPVTGFGTGTVRSGETQLGSGSYYVEFRQNADTSAWQFRVVDENGEAVRVDDASDTGTVTTTGWQDFSNVKNSTFDTGRGLTITFANSDPTETQLYGGANTASANYTAQGASISVDATDSLNDILTKINSATYADGNEVQATVVDRRLVLTAERTGTSGAITLDDTSGTVLQDLGILQSSGGGSGGTLATGAELHPAQNAQFSINGITGIERSKNTGLTDVIQGLSIDLKAEGSATITVEKNTDGVVDDVKSMLEKVNDLMDFIQQKTEPVKGSDDTNGNPTYTAAPLSTDWSVRWMRQNISSVLLGEYSGAVGDNPRYLVEVGISVNDAGKFELSDSSKLTAALNDNFGAVQDLFDNILTNLDNELDKYVTGEGSIISSTQDSISTELTDLNDRIDSYEERLQVKEDALRNQYAAIQSQLISMTYQFQSMQAFSAGGLYNSLG